MRAFGPSLYRPSLYQLRVHNQNPTTLVGVALMVLFAYLIAAPILMLLSDAFLVQFADQARARQPPGRISMVLPIISSSICSASEGSTRDICGSLSRMFSARFLSQ